MNFKDVLEQLKEQLKDRTVSVVETVKSVCDTTLIKALINDKTGSWQEDEDTYEKSNGTEQE